MSTTNKPCPNSIEDSFYIIYLNSVFKISPPIRKNGFLDRLLDFCIEIIKKVPVIGDGILQFEKSEYLASFKKEIDSNYLAGRYVNPNKNGYNSHWQHVNTSYLPYIYSGSWAWTEEEAINKIRLRYAINRIADSTVRLEDTVNHGDPIEFQIYDIVYDLHTSTVRLEPENTWNIFPSDIGYIIDLDEGTNVINKHTKELTHILCYWMDYSLYDLDIQKIPDTHYGTTFESYKKVYCVDSNGICENEAYILDTSLWQKLGLLYASEKDAQQKHDRMHAIEEVRQYLIKNKMLCEDPGDPNTPKFMFKLGWKDRKQILIGTYTTSILRYSPYGYVNNKRNLDKFLADNEENLMKIHYYDINYTYFSKSICY